MHEAGPARQMPAACKNILPLLPPPLLMPPPLLLLLLVVVLLQHVSVRHTAPVAGPQASSVPTPDVAAAAMATGRAVGHDGVVGAAAGCRPPYEGAELPTGTAQIGRTCARAGYR